MEKQIIGIDIPQGKIAGLDLEGCKQFLDVPYASDSGRFKRAQRAPQWEGIRDAAKPGPVFPQAAGRLSFVMGNTEEEKNQSEGAFSVNIWTPDTEGAYPVLFWMHGGAFMTGGGAIPWYSDEAFAREMGIVVVNVSYRLGVLGNLYLPGVADTNLSVHDVNQALIWVHDNIRYFGGDPDNITIAGFLSLTTARSFPVDLAKAGRDMTKTERISKYLTDTINAAAGTEGVGSQRFPF